MSSTTSYKPTSALNRRTLRQQAMDNIHQIQPHQFSGSSRVYLDAGENIQVPCRAVTLTDAAQSQIFLYDCSGAFGDPAQKINVRSGLPRIRQHWLDARKDTAPSCRQFSPDDIELNQWSTEFSSECRQALPGKRVTQLHYARAGIITAEMKFIACRENMARANLASQQDQRLQPQQSGRHFGAIIPATIDAEFVRAEVAAGRAIIPLNINHPEAEPMIIGRNFLVKVNANIGNSAVSSSIEEEVEKLIWATRWGADTV
ncbi:MAG: phosphomethylpyrimidine synthase ThiC, partial [Gammaproteobacteria bacterium]|nr:phosphomethylpyrimidine synthase ThiC [Gammaproteobacteria bacterium]